MIYSTNQEKTLQDLFELQTYFTFIIYIFYSDTDLTQKTNKQIKVN